MISKDQLGNNCVNKWEDYGLIIEKNVFEKIKQFEPINSNANKNNKGFRISKNRRNTDIFQKLEEYQRNCGIAIIIIFKVILINKIMKEFIRM